MSSLIESKTIKTKLLATAQGHREPLFKAHTAASIRVLVSDYPYCAANPLMVGVCLCGGVYSIKCEAWPRESQKYLWNKLHCNMYTLILFSCVQLFATVLWTVARQRLLCLFMILRQEYWSGLSCPPQGYSDPGIEHLLCLPNLQAGSLPLSTT